MALEEPERLALDVLEEAQTQGAQEPLTGPVHQQVLPARADVGEHRHEHVAADGEPQLHPVAGADPGVDPVAHEQRTDDGSRRGQGHERDGCRRGATLVDREATGAPEDAPGRRRVETLGRVDPGPAPHQRTDPLDIASDGGPTAGSSGRLRAARTEL